MTCINCGREIPDDDEWPEADWLCAACLIEREDARRDDAADAKRDERDE